MCAHRSLTYAGLRLYLARIILCRIMVWKFVASPIHEPPEGQRAVEHEKY
jgi:hypothetical protein